MADDSGLLKAYTDAIANIEGTAKWMITALGAIFTVMLGGIQFNTFGFAEPGGAGVWVWVALAIALSTIALALWLASAVLVREGISLDQLTSEARYQEVRNYINKRWAYLYPGQSDVLSGQDTLYKKLSAEVQAHTRKPNDANYLECRQRLTEAVYIADWRDTLARFKRLKLAFIGIIPAAAASVLIMVSYAHTPLADGKGRGAPEVISLTITAPDRTALTAAGVPESCIGQQLWALVYRNADPGIDEAATFPSDACPSRNIVVLDHSRIIKVL